MHHLTTSLYNPPECHKGVYMCIVGKTRYFLVLGLKQGTTGCVFEHDLPHNHNFLR